MKILLQIGVVFGVYWGSQCIEAVLPFPFPASVISLLVLLGLLLLGVVRWTIFGRSRTSCWGIWLFLRAGGRGNHQLCQCDLGECGGVCDHLRGVHGVDLRSDSLGGTSDLPAYGEKRRT